MGNPEENADSKPNGEQPANETDMITEETDEVTLNVEGNKKVKASNLIYSI